MKKLMKTWKVITLLAALLFVMGCSGGSHPYTTLPANLFSTRLVVLPFYAVRGEGAIVACPVCGKNNPAGPILPDARGTLTDMLVVGLQRRGYKVVPMSDVQEEILKVGEKKVKAYPIEAAKELSARLKAKLVVIGVVFEYRAREGSAYGVEKPAAVSFSLHLVDGKTGRILWKDSYSEIQEPLSEDVSNIGRFLKRKGKWVTAQRLAYDGMNTLLDNFPEPE